MKIFFAPIQGSTDHVYRRLHARLFGGCQCYMAPFIHQEHGIIRPRDLKDIRPELNEGTHLVPQIIGADREEMARSLEAVIKMGYREVNLNMGCPFPPQALHGRGSGLVANKEKFKSIVTLFEDFPEIEFSLKMRLGWESGKESIDLLPLINDARISYIVLHPRIGRQQYKGELDMELFDCFKQGCSHPLVYNGDILCEDDIMRISEKYPDLHGIMIGRGLLARPSLAIEHQTGERWDDSRILGALDRMHGQIFEEAMALTGGELQQLQALRQFWTYLEPMIGHKAFKMIRKSTSIRKYKEALKSIF